jgi:hypothetical protein
MKKQIEITQGAHPQSGKTVNFITVLGKQFIMADARGYSMYGSISADFAKQIIAEMPAKTLNADRMKWLDTATDITLSWDILSLNKAEKAAGLPQKYALKIHAHAKGTHIWTSQDI